MHACLSQWRILWQNLKKQKRLKLLLFFHPNNWLGIGQGRVTDNLNGAPIDDAVFVDDNEAVEMVGYFSMHIFRKLSIWNYWKLPLTVIIIELLLMVINCYWLWSIAISFLSTQTFYLLHEEGFFVGASSGINVAAAVQVHSNQIHLHKNFNSAVMIVLLIRLFKASNLECDCMSNFFFNFPHHNDCILYIYTYIIYIYYIHIYIYSYIHIYIYIQYKNIKSAAILK